VTIAPAVLVDVRDFIVERAAPAFSGRGHGGTDQRALASAWTSLPDLEARLQALAGFMGQEAGASLAAANKRIGNILRKARKHFTEIDEDRLILEEERELFKHDHELRRGPPRRCWSGATTRRTGCWRPASCVDRFSMPSW
jgi:glycyl-tRNA synthetase beta subunit